MKKARESCHHAEHTVLYSSQSHIPQPTEQTCYELYVVISCTMLSFFTVLFMYNFDNVFYFHTLLCNNRIGCSHNQQ